jgi:hypothetical protein
MQQAGRRLALPIGTTFEEWKVMVAALLKAGSPAHASRVADTAGLDAYVVEANIEFLKTLGIAEQHSTEEEIHLSAAGALYAQAILSGDAVAQQKMLAQCAAKALKPVIRFCELAEEPSFNRLFLQVKFLAGVEDEWGQHRDTAAHDRAGIHTAIAIMAAAGMIDKRFLPVEEEAA